jgi:hypothetical protein
VGRAGRDGQNSFCHCFYSEKDVLRQRSLTEKDTMDFFTLESMVEKIFGKGKKKHKPNTFVALPLDEIQQELNINKAVVSTMLSQLEQSLDTSYLEPVSCVHNQCSVGFHRTDPFVLAEQVNLVKCILMQNGDTKQTRKLGQRYKVDIVETANRMRVHIADIQRDLIKLKANKEISVEWSSFSQIVRMKE